MAQAKSITRRVAVALSGREGFGIRRFLLTQQSAAARHGLRFEYICLQRGSFSEALEQTGSAVTVCGGNVPRRLPLGPVLTYLRWLLPGGGFWSALRGLRRALRDRDVDIVYSHSPNMHLVCGLAARAARCKAVGQVHGALNRRRLLGLNRVLYCTMMNFMLDEIVTISNYARATLWGRARTKSTMVYNGADLEAIRGQLKTRERSGRQLVVVGRLVDSKKQALAIRALDRLGDAYADCTLELIGGPIDSDNVYYGELKAIIGELHLTNRVSFAGVVSPPYDRVASAAACISCASKEGFGYAVIEAMACETPVIVADRGAPAEIVRDGVTGLHYPADNPEALAATIRRILGDPDLARQLTEAAREDAQQRFGIDAHMEGIREAFES